MFIKHLKVLDSKELILNMLNEVFIIIKMFYYLMIIL